MEYLSRLCRRSLFVCFVVLSSFACSSKQEKKVKTSPELNKYPSTEIKYAKRFEIQHGPGYKVITIDRPGQGATRSSVYLLKGKGSQVPANLVADVIVEVPVKKFVCTSTTQAALLEPIEEASSLVGFPQAKYLYSEIFRSNIANGQLTEVGMEAQLNIERILSLEPDLVMGFSTGSEDGQLTKLKELGIPVVMNADYLETSLLGRAEWIKFAAAFFNKEDMATQYFDRLVKDYDSLKNLIKTEESPTVFMGVMYGSTWFLPGGKNYGAELIKDSGGQYLWSEDSESGWLNLDFEVVYSMAAHADVWIGASDFETLDALSQSDPRYADFKAFKNGQVYSATNRKLEGGANDYFESGSIRPDLLLADHIKMLHPELLPDYDLYYYKKLD